MQRVAMLMLLALTACGGADTGSTKASAEATATAIRTAGGSDAAGRVCAMFTPAEIAVFAGEPVDAGKGETGDVGCQWSASDGSGDVIVAVVPAGNHEPPKSSKNYAEVAVGEAGFVSTYLDGWIAGAIDGKQALRVSVAGAEASAKSAEALLKEAVDRNDV